VYFFINTYHLVIDNWINISLNVSDTIQLFLLIIYDYLQCNKTTESFLY